ncbi:MAG: D-alanyl-D-alanine carboxypeptidase [Clostridia bacterium]|nr:D-alanyl-D-alanine carboxypeptidase [Clostridia bacterium]
MQKRKQVIAALLTVISLWGIGSFFTTAVNAAEPPVSEHAGGASLYKFENDVVLYSVNEDARIYPASTVKIMTGILAVEALGDQPDRQITVTAEMLHKVVGNNISLDVGEIVTVDDMLHALLVNGANDAAQVLAVTVGGSVDGFVTMMNEKAQLLGAYNTYYTNPTGMHNEAMVTTVADTAAIAKYACGLPRFTEITSVTKYVMDETNLADYRNLFNRNSQLSKFYDTRYYYPDAIGLNAGYTVQSGYCLVSVASREDLTYLAIVMSAEGTEDGIYSYKNVNALLDWAFEAYGYREVLSASTRVCEMHVALSSTVDYVTLVPATSLVRYLPTDLDPAVITVSYNTYDESLTAPVEAGQVCGIVTVTAGDEILGSADLIATSSVTRSEFLFFLERIKGFTSSRFFRATIVFVILFSIAYVLISAHRREQRVRRRNIF